MTAAELKRLLKAARESGAATVRIEGIGEFSFGPAPRKAPPEMATKAVEEQLRELLGGGAMPSQEDFLMWSVPGPLPSEIEAAKKAEE